MTWVNKKWAWLNHLWRPSNGSSTLTPSCLRFVAGFDLFHSAVLSLLAGCGPKEDRGRERPDPEGVQPLLRPDHRQRQPGQSLWDVAGGRGHTVQSTPVGPSELGVLMPTRQHECASVTAKGPRRGAQRLRIIKNIIARSALGPAHRATFFLLKTQRERVLIYFITFYERSFYSMWTSNVNETTKENPKLVTFLGHIFALIYCRSLILSLFSFDPMWFFFFWFFLSGHPEFMTTIPSSGMNKRKGGRPEQSVSHIKACSRNIQTSCVSM